MVGDLHCHTNFSDGSIALKDAVIYAKNKSLGYLAITDHDTMEGVEQAVEFGKELGVTVIPGVEISCMDARIGRKVHLLCYLPIFPKRLAPLLTKISDSRRKGNIESLRLLQQYQPVTDEMVARHCGGDINRLHKCHIMNALLDMGLDNQIYGDMYKHYFSRNSPEFCRANIDYEGIYSALHIVHDAGGIAILAHPGENNNLLILEDLIRTGLLDGVELYHPSNTNEDKEQIAALAKKYDLIVTGGTDFHGYYSTPKKIFPLGTFTTDQHNIDRIFDLYEKRKKEYL